MVTPPQIGYGLAVVVLLYFGYTPLWVYRTIIAIIFTGFGAVLPSGPPLDGSLRESMRNVTRDYDQLATIVQEFFATNSIIDPQTEARFQEFLSQKASRSYPKLEGLLDFLLFIYKIAWPFVVMTTAIKLMGRKEAAEVAVDIVDTTAKIQKKVDNGPTGTSELSYKTAGTSKTNR